MDATVWTESQCASRNQDPTIALLRQNPAPVTDDALVSVMVLYADPVIAAGLAGVLREHTDFQIVPTTELGNVVHGPPPANVVLADYETAMGLAERAPQWTNNVVVFTNHDSEAKISRAIEIGARGYLLFGAGLAELFEGIRSVHRGGVALSPLVAARVTNRVKGKPLTARERAVLGQLMLGITNKEIASRLDVRVGTVKTHIKAIFAKLNATTRMAAVLAAQRRGLLP